MHTPKIFISATSGDLGSVRQIVKEALLTINCHPVEQTNFEPDARTVADMLRGKIGDCQALIHICGLRYGAEPDVASLPPGAPRRSYTQWEYHIGRQLQEERGDNHFRVYTFICPEAFPYDEEPDSESQEKRELQKTHRSRLFDDPHLREKPRDGDDLKMRILALQEQVFALKHEQAEVKTEVLKNRLLGLKALAVFLLICSVIGFWQWQMKNNTHTIQKDTQILVTKQVDIGEQMSQVQEALSRIQQQTDPQRDPISGWSHERLEKELARYMNWKEEDLRALLSNAKTSLDALIAGQALMASGRAEEADLKFDTVITQEQSARLRLIQAYRGKADISDGKAHYNVALDYRQKAAALMSKNENPVAWAEAQLLISMSLKSLGRYREAEMLLREILSISERHLGENAAMTAFSLSLLSGVLAENDRHSEEAEACIRRALVIFEKIYPPRHAYIKTCRVNLAQLLLRANKLTESEDIFRRNLIDAENEYDPDDIGVTMALSNLGWMHMYSGHFSLAEPLFRRALEISKVKLGANHPRIAISLSDLAQSLIQTGQAAEAEPLINQALLIIELNYGPDNPKVADQLAIKVQLLQAMNRLLEIEPLLRRSLSIREAVYSMNHPSTVMDRYILALLLLQLNKLDESELFLRRVIADAVDLKISNGKEHPHFRTMIAAYRRLLTLRNLPDDQINARLREALGPDFARTINGPFQVVVTEVVKGGQAEALGIQAGDIYLSYNGQIITSVDQFIRLTEEAKGEAVPIEVLRDAKKLNLIVQPGKLGTVIQNRTK